MESTSNKMCFCDAEATFKRGRRLGQHALLQHQPRPSGFKDTQRPVLPVPLCCNNPVVDQVIRLVKSIERNEHPRVKETRETHAGILSPLEIAPLPFDRSGQCVAEIEELVLETTSRKLI